MLKHINKVIVATAVCFAGLSGVAAAQATIEQTGPGSDNQVKIKNIVVCKTVNKNNIVTLNLTAQKSKTGKAKVKWNTTGGSAVSGSALNANATTTSTDVTNNSANGECGCGCVGEAGLQGGSISDTGPWSWNNIYGLNVNKQTTINNNNILVGNATFQYAGSGDALVIGNTTGGDATSGNASNTNSTSITVTVSNN
jgi:hypothetical protein